MMVMPLLGLCHNGDCPDGPHCGDADTSQEGYCRLWLRGTYIARKVFVYRGDGEVGTRWDGGRCQVCVLHRGTYSGKCAKNAKKDGWQKARSKLGESTEETGRKYGGDWMFPRWEHPVRSEQNGVPLGAG